MATNDPCAGANGSAGSHRTRGRGRAARTEWNWRRLIRLYVATFHAPNRRWRAASADPQRPRQDSPTIAKRTQSPNSWARSMPPPFGAPMARWSSSSPALSLDGRAPSGR